METPVSKTTEPKLAYSIKETTQQLGLSRAYINTLIARGELGHRKVGRRVLIPRTELERFLAGNTRTQHE